MKPRTIVTLLAATALAGCMAGGSQTTDVAQGGPQVGSPFSDRHMGVYDIGTPLVLDRNDLSIGTTVHFNRIPTASEMHDLTELPGLAHVVLSLPSWPVDVEPLQALDLAPPETQVIVVLPGYPPNRSASQLWNYVRANLRIVVIVSEPPPSPAVAGDLNTMRGLERVIAQMDRPSRWGFERLQRPLSFRKIVE
jgi:hypothetical protein